MALANTQTMPEFESTVTDAPLAERSDDGIDSTRIQEVLDAVQSRIAPVWPLKDYVAVNPYAGLANLNFLVARNYLRTISDLELLMPVDYYRQQFEQGEFGKADIDAAVDELVADTAVGAERIDVNQVIAFLREASGPSPTADAEFTKSVNPRRPLRTFAQLLDDQNGSSWCRLIRDEISKHCATHYDLGQTAWSSPWRDLPLYQAWRQVAKYDRSFEFQGVAGFRRFVSHLPQQPDSAVVMLLNQLGVPPELWADYLLCELLTMPGWSAWTRHRSGEAKRTGSGGTDLAGLLAMRLAHEAALLAQFEFSVNWSAIAEDHAALAKESVKPTNEDLLRYALLKASEIAFRNRLVGKLTANVPRRLPGNQVTKRHLAQMVFCIDVRSERIRRHLESTTSAIETFGFAGFFGLPIEFVGLGETEGSSQVPVLISPQFKVHEQLDTADPAANRAASKRRGTIRFLRKAWKEFQASAVSTFAFVETAGLFYGIKLIARSIAIGQTRPSRFDGVKPADRKRLAPTLRGLHQQGIDTTRQADLAASILRGIGLVSNFGRLVVLCGHGSQTENNPLKAGLDCGACGGHTGEANARLAAKLLNQNSVRQALVERDIEIPDDTHFVAATHNTTTDAVEFFDVHEIPESHQGDLKELRTLLQSASAQTGRERLTALPGRNTHDLVRRSLDWSEVRPEWGLAGNAAFIAAPRELTETISLGGRAFLHSYDYRQDPSFAVLEQIMTAPLVVANWINMQYYASTVDPIHFGSGNKTVHNVVGRFGIFSGNGGDLMTGLPWQSIHDGKRYQHHPLRLLAVIAAPPAAIESIVAKHEGVGLLLGNGWLQLIAIENGNTCRYTERQEWEVIATAPAQPAAN